GHVGRPVADLVHQQPLGPARTQALDEQQHPEHRRTVPAPPQAERSRPSTRSGSASATWSRGSEPSGSERPTSSPARSTVTGPSSLTTMTVAVGSSKLYRRAAVWRIPP